jgi:hypothetical protein
MTVVVVEIAWVVGDGGSGDVVVEMVVVGG